MTAYDGHFFFREDYISLHISEPLCNGHWCRTLLLLGDMLFGSLGSHRREGPGLRCEGRACCCTQQRRGAAKRHKVMLTAAVVDFLPTTPRHAPSRCYLVRRQRAEPRRACVRDFGLHGVHRCPPGCASTQCYTAASYFTTHQKAIDEKAGLTMISQALGLDSHLRFPSARRGTLLPHSSGARC